MKKLNLYDQINASTLLLVSPEWSKVKAARKSASSFETPNVSMPTEVRTIAGRQIRIAKGGPTDAPLVVLLSPFPESILSFMGSWEALTEKLHVITGSKIQRNCLNITQSVRIKKTKTALPKTCRSLLMKVIKSSELLIIKLHV